MEQRAAIRHTKEVLWVIAIFGLVVGLARFITGLGASSYMSDAIPWGLWKIFNMVAGAALATGGFVVACIIYVLRLEKYRPLARVAIVVAFLGYGASLTALLFDIGLPHRFWHPFFIWNPHSFLFEVFWCVSCYWMVTAFEMLPIIFERLPWPRLTHFLHEIALPIIVIGITLSTMHHSSLGSLFMVSPTRLHPLWLTTWIPLQFFISAMGSGMATLVLITMIYSWLYNRELNMPVLGGMAKGSAAMLLIYLAIRAADFTVHHKWNYVIGPDVTWETWVFIAEILLQAIIPIFIFLTPVLRKSTAGLFVGTASAAVGLAMHRIDVGIVGYFRTAGEIYIPSLGEFALSFGVISAAALVFLFIAERFYVFDEPEVCASPETDGVHVDQAKQWTLDEIYSILLSPGALRVSLVVVVSIPLAMLVFRNQALSPFEPTKEPVQQPVAMDELRTTLKIDGNRQDESVEFLHQFHQEFMGGEESCQVCHHLSLPNDKSTACFNCHKDMYVATSIFDHELHQHAMGGPQACDKCHNLSLPKGPGNAPACFDCHDQDMPGMADYKGKTFSYMAPGYKDAMHGICLTCHRRYGKQMECMDQADCVGNCQACHPLSPE